jgi:hypothetical protein
VRKVQTLSLFLLALTVNFGKCKLYIYRLPSEKQFYIGCKGEIERLIIFVIESWTEDTILMAVLLVSM